MKTKRCTNSSCRKVFRVESHHCPYCGKKYPRAMISDRYALVLTYVGPSKWQTSKMILKHTGLGLYDSVNLLQHVPSLIGRRFQASQAEALRADIRAVGSDAMVIPASRGTRGIFVLPEQAG